MQFGIMSSKNLSFIYNLNTSPPNERIPTPISGVTGGGGGGAGGQSAPRDFWPGNFCWRIGKKEARKKGKRGENWEEKVENWKWKQENVRKRGEDFFFFTPGKKSGKMTLPPQKNMPVTPLTPICRHWQEIKKKSTIADRHRTATQ